MATPIQEGRGERIAAAPFAAWLNARIARHQERIERSGVKSTHNDAVRQVATECGWKGEGGMRILWRYRSQKRSSCRNGWKGDIHTETFSRAAVEDALHAAGVLFAEVYPDVAAAEEPREIQPSEWCPACHEIVTPLDAAGDCPWCDLPLRERERRAA